MGIVYFVREDGTSFMKVGVTSGSMESRLFGLQVGNPRELKVFGIIDCADPDSKEKEIKTIWSDRCIRGEWFNFTDAQASDILKAHGGRQYIKKSEIAIDMPVLDTVDAINRETLVLLAYEKAIQSRTEPSVTDIERLTEKLGSRVPRTAVWNIINSLKSAGKLPVP